MINFILKEWYIKEWLKLGIAKAELQYDCGNDSMNDTIITFFDKEENVVVSDELEKYFDVQVYNNITFYQNSDGYYIGECGIVLITLIDDDDKLSFNYEKNGSSIYHEQFTETIGINLTAEQLLFVETNVSNINSSDNTHTIINFKHDFIITDNEEKIIDEIGKLVDIKASNHVFQVEGTPMDWYSCTTNNEGELLQIDENNLILEVSRSHQVYRDSDE